VVVHYEGMSGAVRSLRLRLAGLADEAALEFVVPGPGQAERELSALGPVQTLGFSALMFPDTLSAAPGHLVRLGAHVRQFRRHFRQARPDLVVVTSSMVPAAVLAARREGVPVLVHASELLNGERLPSLAKRGAARVLRNRTARWASAVIACSDAVADQFEHSEAQVETLYPPIADLGGGDREGFRGCHGIAPHEVCVTAVGNITRGRGQDLLLRAMPKVRARVPAARCLIVGDPFNRARDLEYRQRLENLAQELELGDGIAFVQASDRIADVYAAADIVVNPARIPESFGRVACEALTAGRPVVATRVGAVPEILDHGRTALLVEPDSSRGLAEAVIELAEDPALAARLAAVGRDEVLRRFDPGQISVRFRELVEALLAEGEEAPQPLEAPPAPSAQPPHPVEAPALKAP
jgi:glycosyltransferase involved in cell wall biosynthesis